MTQSNPTPEGGFEVATVKAITDLMTSLDKIPAGSLTQASLLGSQNAMRKIATAHQQETAKAVVEGAGGTKSRAGRRLLTNTHLKTGQ